MFDPAKAKSSKDEKAARRKALATIKGWCLAVIPIEIHEGLILDVKEIVCGDPSCAPVSCNIAVNLIFDRILYTLHNLLYCIP